MKTKTDTTKAKNSIKNKIHTKPAAPKVYVKIERPVQRLGKSESSYRVLFKTLDGDQTRLDVPRKLFGKPGDVVGVLLDAHADMPLDKDNQKKCVVEAIENMTGAPTLRLTDRAGWDRGSADASFVYYDRTFGPSQDTLSLDDDANRNPALGKKSGTAANWRNGLEEPCRHSDHLIFAAGIAASGPLHSIVDAEPAIYHFEGARKPSGDDRVWKSSSGKTLSARCGQSLLAACSRTELFSFNMTALAVEETCFSCNNMLVVLDEEGAAGEGNGAHMISADVLPYRIVGGQGRRRSKSYSLCNGLANRAWVVPVITTAEDELDATKSARKEGSRARMVSIPFPPTWQGGTFNAVADASERTRLAKLVEETIGSNHGVVMPKFLQRLVKDRATVGTDIQAVINDFVQEVGAAGNTWEKRYAEKFGIVLAAAILMVRYDLAPWTESRAKAAVTNLYNASRGLTVSVPQATDAVLERLRKAMTSKMRFPRLTKGENLDDTRKKAAWGVKRDIGNKKNVVVVRATRFEKLVVPSAVSDQVLDELAARGLLLKDSDGNKKRQLSIKGLTNKRVRYVCIEGLMTKAK